MATIYYYESNHDFRIDRRLSYKARGVLAYIMSHGRDWELHVDTLVNESDEDGRIAVQSALQELIKWQYAALETVRDVHGKVRGKKYYISNVPLDMQRNRQAGNIAVGTDKQENRQTENLSIGTDKQVSRQTQNLLVGHEKNDVDAGPHRQAGFPSDGFPVSQETCSITKTKDLRENQDLRKDNPPTPLSEGGESAEAKALPKHTTESSGRVVKAKAKAILDYFNAVHSHAYENATVIEALLRSPKLREPTLEDCKLVIDYLYAVERVENPDSYKKYVTHTTPFRPENFERHRERARQWDAQGRPHQREAPSTPKRIERRVAL